MAAFTSNLRSLRSTFVYHGTWLLVMAGWATTGCQRGDGLVDTANFPPHRLFRLHCSQCHGDGSGNGHRVTALKAKPKDMTRQEWQASVTDDYLFRVISEGGPANKLHADMPSWKLMLNRRQMKGLVQYIRTLDDQPKRPVVFEPRPVDARALKPVPSPKS